MRLAINHIESVGAAPQWLPIIQDAIDRLKLDTAEQVAMILAQCSHESAHFTRLTENLNYSAEGLLTTWPWRFDQKKAERYARNQVAIANYVYANRYGNSDEDSGDGWRYRGGGCIQLTFKNNYAAAGKWCGQDFEAHPDLLRTPTGAMLSACWYWHANSLAKLGGDVVAVTRKINGGLTGLAERRTLFLSALGSLTAQPKIKTIGDGENGIF